MPAFAEEGNKSRHVVARAARTFAGDGWDVMQIDLTGCGDSTGDFVSASWETWLDDIDEATAWLRARCEGTLWLWGLRAGCLLLADWQRSRGVKSPTLLWQPVLSGAQHLQQFLRLHLAGGFLGKTERRETVRSLRERLRDAGTLEVAGYALPELVAAGLEAAELAPSFDGGRALWLEVSNGPEPVLRPASEACIANLRAAGCALSFARRDRAGVLADGRARRLPRADRGDARVHAGGERMSITELPCAFDCEGDTLIGVATLPAQPRARGLLVVVGGPQYRVGSHRQFVLLARRLAREGFAVMRFDCRGMGDSTGQRRGFEVIDGDIRAAIDSLQAACPAVKEVVLWGLCDAASAAMMYSATDPRVSGLVLLNPWMRSAATLARTHMKHYYARRLLQQDFWRKLLSGGLDFGVAAGALARNARAALIEPDPRDSRAAPFQARAARGMQAFKGRSLLVLSGNDLTAKEFVEYAAGDAEWTRVLAADSLTRRELPQADHTFSNREDQRAVEEATLEFLLSPATGALGPA